MLTFSHVCVSFDGRVALADVTLSVPDASRTAVVGVNGAGKSTLLRLAASQLQPDSGTVTVGAGTTVAYVPQDYGIVAGLSVDAYLRERAGVLAVERRMRQLEEAMARGHAEAADAYADAVNRYASLGGYEVDGRIERALDDLGLPGGILPRPVGELSGGQQVRMGLAGVLASRCELYLLDEPTNNLDPPALEHLERFVTTADATFLLVSHDRAFLDATATDIVEIDEHTHEAAGYAVTFAEYRALREQALAAQSERYREYVAEVDRLKAGMRDQRAAAGRTKDTRPARDNDKFARYFFAQRQSRQAGRAMKSLQQRLARLEAVEEPRAGWELRLSLDAASRSGDLVAEADELSATYDGFTLGPVSLSLRWRDRVALQGHNGAGKSVLLRLLTGAEDPRGGTVRLGSGVVAGVLRQGGTDLGGDASGLAVFQDATGMPAGDARTLLAKFDLGADHVHRVIDNYSATRWPSASSHRRLIPIRDEPW